jgi:NAD(P)-dependent dehydrogenase (short-subunit alcohol dehydrogenase family)
MATQEKVAFITGANRGLGLETARRLGELGTTVLLGSRDAVKGEQAAEELRKKGLKAEAIRFDVTSREDHKRLAEMLEQRFGRLDILVNNAGIEREHADFGKPFNTTSTVPEAALRETFDTNFFSVVALTQTLLPLIRKAPAGRIVNLSSVLGSLTLHSDPSSPIFGKKAFAYDASKTALNAFTVHLAAELKGTNIKVNSAHPGWVRTELGGDSAPMELREGGRTSVQLATLPNDGPTGGYFHLGERLPW